MAAIYLDRGLSAVKEFMKPLWIPLIRAELDIPQDSKSKLQEWAQKKYKKLPTYELTNRTGPDHSPVFTVTVCIGKQNATGQGSSKKLAEQNAAEMLLRKIKDGHK